MEILFYYNHKILAADITTTTTNQLLIRKEIFVVIRRYLCTMDANSIITQVSRDDEQLNAFTNEKGIYTNINLRFLSLKLVSSMEFCKLSFSIEEKRTRKNVERTKMINKYGR